MFRQSVAFCSHNNSKAGLTLQYRVGKGYGIVCESHGGCLESIVIERLNGGIEPCPRHEEHTTHRHPHCTPVERVARTAGEQHTINTQCCSRTEYGSDIRGIHHTIYHHYPTRSTAYLLYLRHLPALHRTEHSAGECVSCERGQHIALTSIYRYIGATGYDVGGISRDMLPFAQQGKGLISCIKSHTYHLGTLGNEKSRLHLAALTQLSLGERTEDVRSRGFHIIYIYYIHHRVIKKMFIPDD